MKKLTILFILILLTLKLAAQTVYPVRTYTVLTPPMSYSLSGFASEPRRMQLNINVDDVSLERYPVYFRLVIKGNGIKLHTKPNMYQEPYYLDGGMHEVLTGFDLEELFNPQNLLFEGYSLNEYKRTGRLPEGVYQVYVELWDYYHKINVSQAMPGVAVMYLTRAPRLTFPMDEGEVDLSTNPVLRFSWMGSMPNDPTTDPVYRFNLYEIRPEGRNPYEIVRVSAPVFTEDTKLPYLLYDMGMPPLEEGLTYAWQVQAVDLEERAKFQNDGLSEVFTFRYGKQCETPDVEISKVTTSSVSIKISGSTNVQLYRVYYKTTDDEDWQTTETDVSVLSIDSLQDNTGYEIKVIALCGDEESDETDPLRFKTNMDVDYTCGKEQNNFDVSNTEPLAKLNRFDFFKAADFTIQVGEAKGDNGRFTGSGFALVPYLGFIKFAVTFDNVFINSDRRMTEGSVKFVYDESNGLVLGLGRSGSSSDDEEGTSISGDQAVSESTDEQVEVDGEITNIQVGKNKVTVTTKDGKTKTVTVEEGQTVGITSKNDDTVYVADTGSGQVYTAPNPAKGGGASTSSVATPAQTGEYGITAAFKSAENQRYGFDSVTKDTNKKPNAYFTTNKSGDKISWKSLASGGADYLDVTIKGGDDDTLRYIRSSGMLAPSSKTNKGDQLLLTGLPDGEEETLLAASVKKEVINDSTTNEILTEAGAIGLVSYAPITKTVVLVPVNNAQCPDGAAGVEEALNEIYAPAVVNWNVQIAEEFTTTKISEGSFEDVSTNPLSKYSTKMNKVIRGYKKDKGINDEFLYLFFVEDSKCDLDGFMPLTGQYGFIFNFGNNTNVLGHELGHGSFNLRHTFSEDAQYYLAKKTTQNLMDYANGTELWKYQWDLIHDPESITLALFQDDDEGAAFDECTFTKLLEYFDLTQSDSKAKLEERKSLYDNVYNNFKDLYVKLENNTESKNEYQEELEVIEGWSLRGSTLDENDKGFLYERVLKKIEESENNESITFNLHEKGIYLGVANIDDDKYNLAIYSDGTTSNIEKLLQDDYCDLIEDEMVNKKVKVAEIDDYLLLAFFNEGEIEMVIQMMEDNDEKLKKLLVAFNVLKGESVFSEINNGDFELRIYEGEDEKLEDHVFLISTSPEMPDVRASIVSEEKTDYKVKIVIEYLRQCSGSGVGRTPNQSEAFPSSGWKDLKSGEFWDIDFGNDLETNRSKIRGGIAYLIAKSNSNQIDTLRFFVKGQNPTVNQVNTFVNQSPYNQIWFFNKLVFHESGSPVNLSSNARQFNIYYESHEDLANGWNAYSRCPNFGAPCGWGLMQLDNPAPPVQSLWDWKANIQSAYDLLADDKKDMVISHITGCISQVRSWNARFPDDPVEGHQDFTDGSITYTHTSSDNFDNSDISELDAYFTTDTEGDNHSFLDACWIKTYNGLGQELLHYYYLNSEDGEKPQWEICNFATWGDGVNYYIEAISNQNTP